MIINWIIALLGLTYFFAKRIKKVEDKEKITFKYWLADNLKELIEGICAVVILMLIMTKMYYDTLYFDNIEAKYEIFRYIPLDSIIAALIGLVNYWVLDFITARTKKKLKKNV